MRIRTKTTFSVSIWRAAIAAALASSLPTPALTDPARKYSSLEFWTGVDATRHVALVYSGVTFAPYGHLFSDGLRLRASGGYGRYSYLGERRGQSVSFQAETGYAEALVGYLKRLGPLTAKGFVGIAAVEHDIAPFDPENPVEGQKIGPKLAIELWVNMGASAWSSLDGSWTSAHGTGAARARTGYRVWEDLSLGLEAGLNFNDLGEDARGGLFARYGWGTGEVSVSGGFSGRYLDDARSLNATYMTFNWLTQF